MLLTQNVDSQWIKANAGSGKTTALTERVVQLLLKGVAPEHIVCLTYTKAAASEMRARVLDLLRKLLLESDENCAKRVQKLLETGQNEAENTQKTAKNHPDPAMIAHARSLFGRVLDSAGGGLQLTTIHGFCQSLLARFPLEAGIAPHFSVLEDEEAQAALRRAKHALLTGLESAAPWLADAVALIAARGGEHRFESLADDIIARRRLWEEVWRGQSPESLRAHIYALHGLDEGATQAVLDTSLCDCIGDEECGIIRAHLPQLIGHGTTKYRELGEGLAGWLECAAEDRACRIAKFSLLFLTKSGTPRATLLNKKEYPPEHNLSVTLAAVMERIMRYAAQSAALASAEESYAAACFARGLIELYAGEKVARHALDYDDLIAHTLRLISLPDTLGWVMSKLDHRIDHLLIDEAQDNSGGMWLLAKILVEELIATDGGVGSGNLARSLLVVGDEKQSIYSFQGAAPEQFHRYEDIFVAMLKDSASPLRLRALEESWRSAPAVLKFVDSICAQPEIAQAIQTSGISPPHILTRENACGRVALYPPILAPEKETSEPLIIPTEYRHAASAAQLLTEHIAETVHRWLNVEKRTLVTKEGARPMTAGDILILVRNRRPLVNPLIRTLQRRGIPVAGLDRLTLCDHLAVSDLLALMGWCMNTGDDLALAQVLRSPIIGMSDEELREYAYGRTGSLWQEVQHPWLREALSWKECTPYDFLTQVLEVSNRRRDFARRFSEEVHEVLDELKAQAASMPSNLTPTLANFYEWVKNSAREIKREQESATGDKLRIMTVHGAKGLEAPVVLLADTVSVPTTQRERAFWLRSAKNQLLPALAITEAAKAAPVLVQAKQDKRDDIHAEYYRLLYVAITRARDELHIFGTTRKEGEVTANSWYEAAARAMGELNAIEKDGVLVVQDAPSTAPPSPKPVAAYAAQPLPDWVNTPPPSIPVKLATLAPSSFAAPQISPYAVRASGQAKERGVRVHRVLELLRADSNAASIEKLVRYLARDWDAKQQAQVLAEINKLFTQEHWLWQHTRMAEVSIAGTISHNGENIAVSGQIDLLVETPEEIIILDYKTGAHVPAEADVPLNYLLQLKIYHALVTQIYPGKPVRVAILWTSGPKLMWLDEAVMRASPVDIKNLSKGIVAA